MGIVSGASANLYCDKCKPSESYYDNNSVSACLTKARKAGWKIK